MTYIKDNREVNHIFIVFFVFKCRIFLDLKDTKPDSADKFCKYYPYYQKLRNLYYIYIISLVLDVTRLYFV